MKPITIRIPEELRETLDAEAAERGVSVSEYVRGLIQQGREYEDLEEQLARRSQLEDRVDDLAVELRADRAERAAPWPVRWARWWRERG